MDNQQGPTVQQRELSSVLFGSLDGRGVWGRMDTCICTVESFFYSPETITTFFVNWLGTRIQLKKNKVRKREVGGAGGEVLWKPDHGGLCKLCDNLGFYPVGSWMAFHAEGLGLLCILSYFEYLLIWLHRVLVMALGIFDLCCSTWNLYLPPLFFLIETCGIFTCSM